MQLQQWRPFPGEPRCPDLLTLDPAVLWRLPCDLSSRRLSHLPPRHSCGAERGEGRNHPPGRPGVTQTSSCAAGLYQVGPRNQRFSMGAISLWLLNACYQAGIMFAMVICGTYNTHIARPNGQTFSHWQVGHWQSTRLQLPAQAGGGSR